MQADAHLHAPALARKEPDFMAGLPVDGWRGALVAHDQEELAETLRLRPLMPPTLLGFGIHPQSVQWDTLDALIEMAKEGSIDFVGETGFDLFGDTPLRVRNAANLAEQRRAFEFQLNLAIRYSLPILVHSRKATDVLMAYGNKMAKLPSVIFHCWPGRLVDAASFLKKGVQAYFSFGTPILRDGRHALESCAGLPADRILCETDAPFQPPHGAGWTRCADLRAIIAKIAAVREIAPKEAEDLLYRNFRAAFGTDI